MDIPKHITREQILAHLRDTCANCGDPNSTYEHLAGKFIGTINLCRRCKITLCCIELVDKLDEPHRSTGRTMLVKSHMRSVRRATGMDRHTDHEVTNAARAYARQAARLGVPTTVPAAITTARTTVRQLEGQRVPAADIPAKASAAGRAHLVRVAIERLVAADKARTKKGGKKKDKNGKAKKTKKK
jgi:hypothetical protein